MALPGMGAEVRGGEVVVCSQDVLEALGLAPSVPVTIIECSLMASNTSASIRNAAGGVTMPSPPCERLRSRRESFSR